MAENKPALTAMSLGAGVQSSVIALMAEKGIITPKPDAAIFADTGWEKQDTYIHLDWLEQQLSFPVYRVSNGNLRKDVLHGLSTSGTVHTSIPAFTLNDDGGKGILRRQCTVDYKIRPIQHKIRALLGYTPRNRLPKDLYVDLWIGISTDESIRMKDNKSKWIHNKYPLIDMNFSREDCKQWFSEHYEGRYLPRSSCIGCPYHDNGSWANMKENDKESWNDALFVDRALRYKYRPSALQKVEIYLHRNCKPLDQVDLPSVIEDKLNKDFANECEGMCGV